MTRRHNTTTSPKMVDHNVTLSEMLKARIQGKTWDEIAALFGYTHGTNAQKAVKNHVQDIVTDSTEEYRAVINGRFELLFNAYWQQAITGDLQAAYFIRDVLIQLGRFNGVGAIKVEQNLTQNNNTLIILPDKGQLPADIAQIIEGQGQTIYDTDDDA